MSYVNLKLRLKKDGKLYAILGTTGLDKLSREDRPNGGYRVTPMDEVEQHGLVPCPWLEYRPETVRVVNEGEVESFLAYSV